MTYRQFLATFQVSLKDKKVFLVDGGTEAVRSDVLHILEKRFDKQKKALNLLHFKKTVYHLSEIVEFPYVILSESVYNLIILRWEAGLLNEKVIKILLRGFRSTKSWFVILDGSGEVIKLFMEIFPKGSSGVHVDCYRLPDAVLDKKSLVRKRLGVLDIVLDDDVISYLANRESFDDSQIFNTFRILEVLGGNRIWVGVSLDIFKMYGLLVPNIEYALMRILFDKGKLAFLSVPKLLYNDRKLIRYIIRELILMLKCKTVKGPTDQKRSSTVGVPYPVYLDYKKVVEKIELDLLYRRLFSSIEVFRYSDYPGSVLMLMSVW